MLLVLGTFLAYLPALRGGLIMDDIQHITRPELQSLHGLWRTWFEVGSTSQYYPLLHTAFWVEYRIWGDAVLGYHLVNVLLHIVSACLVVMLVRRLSLPDPWLAGFIFALHPVCVNSVAWIAEQKNTLSAVFYLSAGLAYLYFDQTRRVSQYFLALALFVLALMSKTVTATLGPALLVVFWWKRGRLDLRRDVQPLLPWIAVGAGAGLFTTWVERKFVGAEGPDFALTILERSLVAGRVLWFYFTKLVCPRDLMFIYPRWKIDAAAWWQYLFPTLVLAATFVLWRLAKQGNRGPLAAFLFFVGTLAPVLGFLNVYPFRYSYVADHFQYLATLGVIVPAASSLRLAGEKCLGPLQRFAPWLATGVVAMLLLLTWRQAGVYKDAVTLYNDTLTRNPSAWAAHNNLGAYFLDMPGKLPLSIRHLEAALQLNPDAAEVHHNLGGALSKLPGRLQDAVLEFEAVRRLEPRSPVAHADLGWELTKVPDHLPEGIAELNTALQLDPNFATAHANLGFALLRVPGKIPEAVSQFETALRINPDLVVAHHGLGIAFVNMARWTEAMEQLEIALRTDPSSAEVHNNLGSALMNLGRLPEATSHFEAALRLQPDLPDGHMNLGNILSRTAHWPEAAREYETVLRLAPDYPEAEDNLGVALLEIPGRSREATSHFEAALQNDPDSPEAHVNLGSTLADAGRFPEAISHFEAALRIRPNFAEAQSLLGIVLSKIPGRTAEAIAHLEAALRIKPDQEAQHTLENLRGAR